MFYSTSTSILYGIHAACSQLSLSSAKSQLRHISVTAPLKNGKGELRVLSVASLPLGRPQKNDKIEERGIIFNI
jgi:hypothetical protein